MPADRVPTETSPLLGEQSNALPASTGAVSNTDYHQSPANTQSEQQEPRDAESQTNKNVPMHYIFPVISIGVCLLLSCFYPCLFIFFRVVTDSISFARSFLPRRIKRLLWPAMARLEVI